MFNFKVVPGELFPYPTHKLDSEESESVQTLIEQIRSNDKELSTVGARIATEYGGLGLGHTAHALVCEELGTSGDPQLLSTIQHCGVASYLLAFCGAKEVKGKYLTAMSDGSIIMGWATQEDCGCDISMNATTAKWNDGAFVITGKKVCAFAESATHFLVLAKSMTQMATADGPTEVLRNTMFVVEKSAPGVTVDATTVSFDSAPAADLVGVVGEGFKDRAITVFTEQYVYAAALLGTLKRTVQELRDSVPEKWATTTIASCACTIYAMEAALYALTANLDVPTEDSLLEAAVVNAFIQSRTTEWLYQLSTATPPSDALNRCLKSARTVMRLMEPNDFLYGAAACCGVEDYGLVFQRSSTAQMMQLRLRRSLGAVDSIPLREIDCSQIETAIVSFGNAVEATFVKNTTSVPYQQLVLNRLGEAAGLLYAASAAASRAGLCASKRLPTAKTEKQLAATFISFATSRAKSLSKECIDASVAADDTYKRIALHLCEDALQ